MTCCDFSIVGGAERFIIDIATALDATIITPGLESEIDETYDVSTVKFEFLNKKLPSEPLRQIYGSHLFRKLKLNYDFFVSTDDMSMHYLSSDIPHLYYIFTPRRAFYDMYYEVMSTKHGLKSLIYSIGIWMFRVYDRHYVNSHIMNIACISNNVRNRVRKTYLKTSKVVYPPVHVSKYNYKPHENYWLSVNRVDKWKRVELQIEAFRQMPDKRLVVIGSVYPHMKYVVDNSPPNVEFKGSVTEPELVDLYSKCTGYITTAIDEDFGITPLEAMASGKPVIAVKEGGYLETIIDTHTGILVTPTIDEIITAVADISDNPESYRKTCEDQALRFDYEIFKKSIRKVISEIDIYNK